MWKNTNMPSELQVPRVFKFKFLVLILAQINCPISGHVEDCIITPEELYIEPDRPFPVGSLV